MEMQKLIELIEQWAIDRELDKNGTVEGQLIKTAEEVSELIIGISKGNLKIIKDSIGDVFVTLVVGNLIYNKKNADYRDEVLFMWRLKSNGTLQAETISSKFSITQALSKHLADLLLDGRYQGSIGDLWMDLNGVCLMYGLTPLDCIESAYEEIADRKGVVKDGTFIKEDDLI